jgi:hypothetical protein
MTIVATATNALFDLLTAPFGAHAGLAVFVLSLLVGVAMLLLFKATTDQDRLVAARGVLTGRLYELGLYQDHLGVLFRIQRDLAVANLRYLRWSLPALAAMIVPMVLILAQLDARFGHRPFQPGETTLVTVRLADDQRALARDLILTPPAGVTVDARPVRDPGAGAVTWRVKVGAAGSGDLVIGLPDGRTVAKRLVAGEGAPRLARVRERESLRRVFLNPAEAPLPGDQPVVSVALILPARDLVYAGVRTNWLVALIVFSLLFGIAVKDVLRVRL